MRAKSHFQMKGLVMTIEPTTGNRLGDETISDRNDMKCYAKTDSELYETGSEYSS